MIGNRCFFTPYSLMGGDVALSIQANCWKCHQGFNFTDEEFHNTGVGTTDGTPEPVRIKHAGIPTEDGVFKTPTFTRLISVIARLISCGCFGAR